MSRIASLSSLAILLSAGFVVAEDWSKFKPSLTGKPWVVYRLYILPAESDKKNEPVSDFELEKDAKDYAAFKNEEEKTTRKGLLRFDYQALPRDRRSSDTSPDPLDGTPNERGSPGKVKPTGLAGAAKLNSAKVQADALARAKDVFTKARDASKRIADKRGDVVEAQINAANALIDKSNQFLKEYLDKYGMIPEGMKLIDRVTKVTIKNPESRPSEANKIGGTVPSVKGSSWKSSGGPRSFSFQDGGICSDSMDYNGKWTQSGDKISFSMKFGDNFNCEFEGKVAGEKIIGTITHWSNDGKFPKEVSEFEMSRKN